MQQVATQTQALVTSQQNEIMAVRLKLKLKVKLNRKKCLSASTSKFTQSHIKSNMVMHDKFKSQKKRVPKCIY